MISRQGFEHGSCVVLGYIEEFFLEFFEGGAVEV